MSKLLIVEESTIIRAVFKEHLDEEDGFEYEFASSYTQAQDLLKRKRYEFAVVQRVLKDAGDGKIIALCNKHNIAPLVFTKDIDEDFFESFEGAKIVDYVLNNSYNNVPRVIERLRQLKENKKIEILVVNASKIYRTYLKENLNLHNFKVLVAADNEEALKRLELHPTLKLMIVEENTTQIDALKLVKTIRENKLHDNLNILIIADESNSYETSILLNAGANDYIVKQFSRSEFYVRVYQNINH